MCTANIELLKSNREDSLMTKTFVQHVDVFNGDADGILALVQLRLAEPKESLLVTGVKRDIELLKRVDLTTASAITVLDISMEKNAAALEKVLASETDVFYVDHHRSGNIPDNDKLRAIIDTDPNTCTSLLVNDYLNGAYANWAVAAAYGDNMIISAEQLADSIGLDETKKSQLKALGIYVNYNGYGRSTDDLHFHPAELFKKLIKFSDPLDMINQRGSVFSVLEQGYNQDMQAAQQANVLADNDKIKVVQLPDDAWARRVSGVFGNELANQSPNKAHAVLTSNADGMSYTVSVRAPLSNKQGADEVCVKFPSGGGRSAAAGINELAETQIDAFIETLYNYYK